MSDFDDKINKFKGKIDFCEGENQPIYFPEVKILSNDLTESEMVEALKLSYEMSLHDTIIQVLITTLQDVSKIFPTIRTLKGDSFFQAREFLVKFSTFLQNRKNFCNLESNFDEVESALLLTTELLKNPKLTLHINPEIGLSDQDIEKYIAAITAVSKTQSEISVIVNSESANKDVNSKTPYLYTIEETTQFAKLNDSLIKSGQHPLQFQEYRLATTWDLSTVISANKSIDQVVEKIKNNNYTPFEAMIHIHKFCTSFSYYDCNTRDINTSIVGALNGIAIVCVGYSHLVKAICDKLDMPELKATIVSCSLTKQNGKISYHSHNIIKIKDSKYNINGIYREDACWDSKTECRPPLFANFLTPISDSKLLKAYKYENLPLKTMREIDISHFIKDYPILKTKKTYKVKIIPPESKLAARQFIKKFKIISLATLQKGLFTYEKLNDGCASEAIIVKRVNSQIEQSVAIAECLYKNDAKIPLMRYTKKDRLTLVEKPKLEPLARYSEKIGLNKWDDLELLKRNIDFIEKLLRESNQ